MRATSQIANDSSKMLHTVFSLPLIKK